MKEESKPIIKGWDISHLFTPRPQESLPVTVDETYREQVKHDYERDLL